MAGSQRPEESIMRWRALLLSGFFAASIGLGYVSTAAADPPPWAGRWQHNKHYNGSSNGQSQHYGWNHDAWRHEHWRNETAAQRQQDYWNWRREQATRQYDTRYGSGRYGYGYGYPGNYNPGYYNYGTSAVCSGLNARIARDQSKINEFSTTGRHQKAQRWFEKDMQSAMNARGSC
jgi:hypothetical protein